MCGSFLTIWCFGQTALYLLAKAALASLPTALCVALRPLFPSQHAQYAQVFPLKPASFCKVFAGLGSTNKSDTCLLLSDSRSVLFTLSSPPSFLLPQSLGQIWQELFSLSCSLRLQWVPGHSFLWVTTWLMRWPNGKRCSCSQLSPVVSLLFISRIHSCLLSDWRRIVSSKFFDIQAPSISTEELVLPCHARCVFSCLCCNGHSFSLSSYLFRVGSI